MNNNNNFSVLPFYTAISQQFHRLPYSYGAYYPLYCQVGELLPFQIQRAHLVHKPITGVYVIDSNGTIVSENIAPALATNGMTIVPYIQQGIDVIVYASATPLSSLLQFQPKEGRYYLRVTDSENVWYSEMFTWVSGVSNLLRVQWYDDEDLISDSGIIEYKTPKFVNDLYLCTEVGKPDYDFVDEGEERDGYYFPVKQLSEKTYKAVILAPEYLCDVMRLIRMADHIRITDTNGVVYDCDTFEIEVKWEEQGNLASVVMTWQTNTVVKKVGVAYMRRQAGDYNIDYNNDYNNEE